MIIEQLQSIKFEENESELSEIRKKIINKIENKEDDYYNEKDYLRLLEYCLTKKDWKSLKILLDSTLIKLLSHEVFFKFSEKDKAEKLYKMQFQVLVNSLKAGNLESVNQLLNFSFEAKSNLNKKLTPFQIGEMLPGATLIQLALKNSNLEMVKLLLEKGADLATIDYYGNSILHYAAMGGEETYRYALTLGISSSENIFGHFPEDYFNKTNLLKVKQKELIQKFIAYMKLKKYDEN